jgi:DNA-directed RNA polymerase subunit RPC12/RpoP
MTYVCVTCGTQFPPADSAPKHCSICEDERQYIGLQGQRWIRLGNLRATHRNTLYQEGEGIWGIGTEPKFAIGQRALLIQTGAGNILWDCISLIDSHTVALVQALGGIASPALFPPASGDSR